MTPYLCRRHYSQSQTRTRISLRQTLNDTDRRGSWRFVRIVLHCADPHFRLLNRTKAVRTERVQRGHGSHFSPNTRRRPGSSRVRPTRGNGHITNTQLQDLFGPIWRPARGSGFGPHLKQLAMTVFAQAKTNCTMEQRLWCSVATASHHTEVSPSFSLSICSKQEMTICPTCCWRWILFVQRKATFTFF